MKKINATVIAVRVHTVAEQAVRNTKTLEAARLERAVLIRKYGVKAFETFKEILEGNYANIANCGAKALAAFQANEEKLLNAKEYCARKLVEKTRTSFVTDGSIEGTVNTVAGDAEGNNISVRIIRKDGKRAIVAIR